MIKTRRIFLQLGLALTLGFTLGCADPASAETAAVSPHVQLRGPGLAGFAERAMAGEALHVATLGGSITQNGHGHSQMVPDWLSAEFPDAEFTFTNAGFSSTCSVSGAFRIDDHILSKGALDLLVVEFAVNDDQDAGHSYEEAVRGMEGIVRKVRRDSPNTGIVMVHYVNQGILAKVTAGEVPTSIAAHEAVAEHYGVTTVNVAAALAARIAEGTYSWKEYGGVHPGESGYQLATDQITAAIAALVGRRSEAADLPAPLDAASYGSGQFVHPEEATWEEGADWVLGNPGRELLPVGGIRTDYESWPLLRGGTPGQVVSLDFVGNAVGAFVFAGPDAGAVETRVDGGDWTTTELFHHYSGGLNYPRSVVFARGLADGEHRLELRISEEKHAKSQGTTASVLWFEVNGVE